MERPILVTPLLALILTIPAHSQEREPIDLLNRFDASQLVESGEWNLSSDELHVAASKGARAQLLPNAPADYDLTLEFTRMSGNDSVVVILPVGGVSPALELSGWGGEAHGLSRIAGQPVKSPDNPTSTRPGQLENGKRYRLDVTVRSTGVTSSVKAGLDGKVLFDWTGNQSDLQPNLVINLPTPGALGLAAHECEVVFHHAVLTPKSATPPPAPTITTNTNPIGEDGSINLGLLGESGTPGWEPFNGAAFSVETGAVRLVANSRPAIGSKDRGAFIKSLDFSEGIIEVDLKGSSKPQGSFLGVVFHGVDGKSYDAVYFRPFNFGSPDDTRRGHAVQYMSHPDFPWMKLRGERPEEFENPANPEPGSEDWFHAKVVISKERIQVFVDNSETPCLEVEKLGTITKGKAGLWFNGEAAFANLKISPTET